MASTWRVRGQSAFADLRRRGRRSRSGPVSVTWVEGPADGTPPKVAYAIGKAVGGAVTRNLVRRRLQAAIATAAPDLSPGTYLIGAGPAAATASYAELADSLTDALAGLPRPGGLSGASELRTTGVA
ncbi:MAG: ribonuclease P protein component [Acidimicrobiales bacterium]